MSWCAKEVLMSEQELHEPVPEEKETADKLIQILKGKGYNVATHLLAADKFWIAEEYHQDYYVKKSQQPYCHAYQKRF